MNKSVAFAFIVLGLVGTIFGIQYIVENYNKPICLQDSMKKQFQELFLYNLSY